MNLVYGLTRHQSLVTQLGERKVIDSIPVRDSYIFLCPTLVTSMNTTSFFNSNVLGVMFYIQIIFLLVFRLAENKFEFEERETDLLVHKILLEEVPW